MAGFEAHKDLTGFVGLQTATRAGYKEPVALPSAALGYSPTVLNIRGIVNEEVRPDHTGRMILMSSIVHAGEAEWDTTFPLEPSGTAGTASDHVPFFRTGIFNSGRPHSAVDSALANGTVSEVTIGNPGSKSAGMVVPIETSAGAGKYRYRQIVSVTTASAASGSIQVHPMLSRAVSATCKVGKSTTYPLDNECTNTSMTLWSFLSTTMRRAWGAVAQSYNISWGGNVHPVASLNGVARGYTQAAPTSLASAVTVATGTTLKLHRSSAVASGTVVVLDQGNSTLSEVVRLTSKPSESTYNMATSARGLFGTTPTSHVNGAKVGIYIPSPTLTGKPIAAPTCYTDIGWTSGGVTSFEGTEGSISFDGGIAMDEQEFGDDWRHAGYNKTDGDMFPLISLTGRLTASSFTQYTQANAAEQKALSVQLGNTPGSAIGFFVPQGIPKQFESTAGDGKGSVGVTVQLEGRGTRDSFDGLYYVEG